MAIIDVDGKKYEVDEKENMLHACLSVGLDLPYFCWHPALGSIGACRQCAVVAVPRRKRHDGARRHGVHDAGREQRAHLDRGAGARSSSANPSSNG